MSGDEIARPGVCRSAFQLCKLSDRDFVRSAYLTLLGREADFEGEQLFTRQLRSGMAKTRIILAMRSSGEGRKFSLQLPGLRTRLILARLFSLPVIAQLAMPTSGEYSNGRRARARRRLENEVARLGREHEVAVDSIAQLAGKVDRLIKRVNEAESARHIGSMSSRTVLTVEHILDLTA